MHINHVLDPTDTALEAAVFGLGYVVTHYHLWQSYKKHSNYYAGKDKAILCQNIAQVKLFSSLAVHRGFDDIVKSVTFVKPHRNNTHSMNKVLVILFSLLIIGAVAVLTCPDKQAHKDAIVAVINEKINDELTTDDPDYQELSAIFGSLGTGVASYIIDNRLAVKNHFFWSTGSLQDLEGLYHQVSIGVFGHIFSFKKEDIDRAIDETF